MEQRPNPYLTALVVIGGLAALAALLLAAASNAQLDPFDTDLAASRAFGAWSEFCALVAVAALIGTLVAMAARWQPKSAAPTPPVPTTTSHRDDGL